MSDVKIGSVFEVQYPFVREAYQEGYLDEGGYATREVLSWRPGVDFVPNERDDGGVADGVGKMLLTVVDVHKPGKYATRCFYTRAWTDPDGKQFGITKLRITTLANFTRLSRGFRYDFGMR